MTHDLEKADISKLEAQPCDDSTTAEDDCYNVIDSEKIQGGLLSLTDDPNTPTFTFRSVTIGCFFAILLSVGNTILSFRTNSISIPDSLTIIVGYPIGVAMAKLLPRGILNPGDFSIKEHVLVNMIAYSAAAEPYGLDNVIGQRRYLNQESVTFWSSLAFVLTTQLIGFGLAGMTRRFLVKPKVMLWPYNFTVIALYRVFHENTSQDTEKQVEQEQKSYSMSRSTFFWLVLGFIFLYELIPNYFALVIQSVSILCFFSSSNLATMFGSSLANGGGLGAFALSFDWNLIGSRGLYTPYYIFVNMTISYVLFGWIIPLLMELQNPLNIPFLMNPEGLNYRDGTPFPAINTPKLFNSTGHSLKITTLMDRTTLDLNAAVYNRNAPIYLTNPNALMYMNQFLVVASTLSHVFLWYGKTIMKQIMDMLHQRDSEDGDIHTEMMKKYWDFPEWIYFVYTAVMLVLQIFILQFTAFKLEWWGTLLAFAIAFVFILPTGVIQALTNKIIGLNVITEFIIGYIIPGKTVQVMTFKSFGYCVQSQALNLSSNLKLGYHMHIPPVAMVASQFIGTIIGGIVQFIVQIDVL